MTPSSRKRRSTRAKPKTMRTTRKPGRILSKKQVLKPKNGMHQEASSVVIADLPSNSSTANSCSDCSKIDFDGVDISTTACSTPKAERFRIPEILTCPPAPRKQKGIANCSLQRRPIAFYAPPDLELFFFYALHDISV